SLGGQAVSAAADAGCGRQAGPALIMACEIFTASPGFYRLAGELCVFHAADIKSPLLDILAGLEQCALDLSGVSEIDTAGVQLLLLMQREAGLRGCDLRLVNHSEPVREVLQLLNLIPQLGMLQSDGIDGPEYVQETGAQP